jgi:hypothetical protein
MNMSQLRSKQQWKELGFRVPGNAAPETIEFFQVPGLWRATGMRYLYRRKQVIPIDPKRVDAARKAVCTRMANMKNKVMRADLTIVSGKTTEEIYDLAWRTHGGNYQGEPGQFRWSNEKARNAIRHSLTNYEELWTLFNRGWTGEVAYDALRTRVDELVNERYPQFAQWAPEVPQPELSV